MSARPADNAVTGAVPAANTARLRIDLGAVVANYHSLRARAAPARCAAVVKADAYGLGMLPVAQALAAAGCEVFFVASLAEGQALRAALPGVEIFVLEGVVPGAAAALAAARLVPVLNSLDQAGAWAAHAARQPCALHLDTGMSRLGLAPAEVGALAARPQLLQSLAVSLVLTHLACADEPGHPLNRSQLDAFHALRRQLPAAPTSIGSSAGIYLGPEFHGDLVRPGISLYGGRPLAGTANPMREVVRLSGTVIQLREIREATPVGYGATASAPAGARLATVGLGYADGYPRCLGGVGEGLLAGVRVPVVGRVSMDSLVVDVTGVPPEQLAVGAEVTLIGDELTVDHVAAMAGTISYELLTGLGQRPRRDWRQTGSRD